MDRIEFMNILNSRSSNIQATEIITNFFDQYMIMYNLCNTINDISIIDTNNNSISFKISYNDIKELQRLINQINSLSIIYIYESMCRISYNAVDEFTIIVTISK